MSLETRREAEVDIPASGDTDIAAVAALLADPVRVRFLLSLRDGQGLSAGQLARLARVSPSAASFHLSKLVAGGLLEVEPRGKHRYFRVAQPELVRAVEALAVVAPSETVTSLRQSRAGAAVRFARICDGHLGGHLGVRLTHALVERAILTEAGEGYQLSVQGLSRLRALGINSAETIRPGHPVTRHPDWSEHGHHFAGPLARALTDRLLELGWITPAQANRAVRLTHTGRTGLEDAFGLTIDDRPDRR